MTYKKQLLFLKVHSLKLGFYSQVSLENPFALDAHRYTKFLRRLRANKPNLFDLGMHEIFLFQNLF